MSAKLTCKEDVFNGFHSYPCARKAKVDGYCIQHHPATIAKRRAERDAKWAEQDKAAEARYAREALERDIAEAVLALTPEERATLPDSVRGLLP